MIYGSFFAILTSTGIDFPTYNKKDWGVDLVDKAKPAVRQGRKATGLPKFLADSRVA